MKKAIAIIVSIMIVLAITFPAAAISSIAVQSIQFDKNTLTLDTERTYDLKVTYTPANTSQKILTYSTSNKNVATISPKGKITGVSVGTATITATALNKSVATCNVNVVKGFDRKNPVTLKIITYTDSFWNTVFEDFSAKNPGIKIERRKSATVDTGVLMPILQSSDAPDLILLSAGPARIGPLAKAGLVEELTPAYASRGWNDEVSPLVLNTLKGFDPKLWEVSNGYDVIQVYYHLNDFQKGWRSTPYYMGSIC